jgi:putative transposase
MLTPTVVRTWAPRGQPPIFRHSTAVHDRISVISAISVSPTRRRVGLYYLWHHHNVRELEAVAFLRHLLRHLRGHVVLIWDNLGVHKGKRVKRLCRRVGAQPGRGRLAPHQRPAR